MGVVWDFVGDGTSKLYASAGRFFYSLPTDLNVRVFTANSAVQTYNYTQGSIVQFTGPQCDGAAITSGMRPAQRELPGRHRVRRARGWLDERREERDPPHQGFVSG